MQAPKMDGLLPIAIVFFGVAGWGIIELVLWLLSHIEISLI